MCRLVLIEVSMRNVISNAMNCCNMLLTFPGTHCNIMNSPISGLHLLTCFDHILSYQEKTTIATEVILIPSPLYEYLVHVFDIIGHMTIMVANES